MCKKCNNQNTNAFFISDNSIIGSVRILNTNNKDIIDIEHSFLDLNSDYRINKLKSYFKSPLLKKENKFYMLDLYIDGLLTFTVKENPYIQLKNFVYDRWINALLCILVLVRENNLNKDDIFDYGTLLFSNQQFISLNYLDVKTSWSYKDKDHYMAGANISSPQCKYRQKIEFNGSVLTSDDHMHRKDPILIKQIEFEKAIEIYDSLFKKNEEERDFILELLTMFFKSQSYRNNYFYKDCIISSFILFELLCSKIEIVKAEKNFSKTIKVLYNQSDNQNIKNITCLMDIIRRFRNIFMHKFGNVEEYEKLLDDESNGQIKLQDDLKFYDKAYRRNWKIGNKI